MLESGQCGSITELATAEKIDRSYLCRVLRLTLLAPEVVEAIVDGRRPEGMNLPLLMRSFPVECRGKHSGSVVDASVPNLNSALAVSMKLYNDSSGEDPSPARKLLEVARHVGE